MSRKSDTVKFSTTHQPDKELEGTLQEVEGLARNGWLASLEGQKVGKNQSAAVERNSGQPTG